MADRQRIMLVDDDPGLRRLLSMRLEAAGYGVDTRESGEEALANIPRHRPDLLITDLRMEGMDGMALFDNVRRKHPMLPVIILTAHGSIHEAVSATRNGAYSFVTKPFDSSGLMEQIQAALAVSGGTGGDSNAPDKSWRRDIITASPLMEELLDRAQRVAASDASVLIRGESGTGKELLARAIHLASPRAEGPFVAVNCGAIPEQLLESELFGHRKGSFTGATSDHEGLFPAASGGTLFLDEIGDMPFALQVKLLRVLQEGQVRPVGSTRAVKVDVRVVSATHRDLEEALEENEFREDLYYRLNVVSLDLPTLGERREDIPVLARHFLKRIARRYDRRMEGFAPEALEQLVSAPWPGNVRQLYNVVEQVVTLAATPLVSADLVREALREEPGGIVPFAEARRQFERDYLERLLQMTGGNVSRAARLARRNRTEFYRLMERHRLDPSAFKPSE
ncbi:MAG TPA: sigma 54-interacting transcriptional regulator [Gammaproteobacteria bacterium]|nr:sigma 54-interacting transcriptional regulator [Gammaproteobacteria bacterium]